MQSSFTNRFPWLVSCLLTVAFAIASVGNSSLPYDPFTPYLLGKDEIRVTKSLPA